MDNYLSSVNNRLGKLIYLVKAFLAFFNFAKWGVIQETYERTSFNAPFSISYSQGGEDLAILSLMKQSKGFYIDVGAHHPNRFSVTRLLYDHGWQGINIDANSEVSKIFKKFRPRDTFLAAAIGTKEKYTFFEFLEPALSTTNTQWKDKFINEGNGIKREVNVIGMKLSQVFELVPDGTSIDLLSIDIEGSDFDALISASFEALKPNKFPKFILVETPIPVRLAQKMDCIKYLENFGYELYCVLPMSSILKYSL